MRRTWGRLVATAALCGFVLGCGARRVATPPETGTQSGTGDAAGRPSPAVPSAGAPEPALALIYTNDVRGRGAVVSDRKGPVGGLARRATLVDAARLQGRAVLQVDAGDFLPAATDEPALVTPAALERRARLLLAAYQRMDVDAVTLGARELQLDPRSVGAWLRASKLPVVLANVIGKNGKPLFNAVRVTEVGGIKVGVFGVVELDPAAITSIGHWKLSVTDAVVAARAAVEEARTAGATLMVGLFNLAGGASRAREIGAAVPGIDVMLVGGGSAAGAGAIGAAAAATETSLLLNAGGDATAVGRLDIRRARSGNPKRWDFENRLLPLDASVRDQLGVALLVQADSAVIKGLLPPAKRPRKGTTGDSDLIEDWTYASTRGCAMCHQAQMDHWLTTDHAHAFATLTKKGRDRDPGCVGCHAVGFLQPGGTFNLDNVQRAFADVGCESCHGPSTAHVRSADKTKGTSRRVDPLICLGCHTPDQSFGPLDLEVAMKEVIGPGHGAPAPPVR